MRQRTHPDKIKVILKYYSELRRLFDRGELKGKMTLMIAKKARQLGMSQRTAYRIIKSS